MAPWNGKERRGVEDPGFMDLTKKDKRKLRRKYRWNLFVDQMFEKRYVLSTIVFTQFILLGLMAYGIVNTNNKANKGVTETRHITEFISEFVQTSAKVGADRNNNVANGLACQTQLLITAPDNRTQPQVDLCVDFFKKAVIPPPTKAQIDALLKSLKG